MKLENKIYTKKELNAHYLTLHQAKDHKVTYTDNVGNEYHFVKVGKDLHYTSMERNKSKISSGFQN